MAGGHKSTICKGHAGSLGHFSILRCRDLYGPAFRLCRDNLYGAPFLLFGMQQFIFYKYSICIFIGDHWRKQQQIGKAPLKWITFDPERLDLFIGDMDRDWDQIMAYCNTDKGNRWVAICRKDWQSVIFKWLLFYSSLIQILSLYVII